MRPVTPEFLAAVRGSTAMTVRARVCAPGQTSANPVGTDIPVIDGDVRLDATADVRSTVDLTTDGTGRWPTRAADPLAPYGNELFVERGIKVNKSVEWVPLGFHRIESPQQNTPPNGPIRLSGKDRMAGLVDARLLAPRQYTRAHTCGAVMSELVRDVYPEVLITWDDGTDARELNRQMVVEEDRHGFLNEMVSAVGKIWYWDHRGALIIRNPPDPSQPVYDINAGAGGVLVSSTRKLTRECVYNAVVASGEAADTDTPARGVAVDADPSSPTYFGGPFGQVPRYFTSPFITDDGQAVTAAAAMLRRQLGLPYAVDFALVPNPALEPWDPVRVRHATTEGIEIHVIQAVTIPLTAAVAMTGTTREQTRILVGMA